MIHALIVIIALRKHSRILMPESMTKVNSLDFTRLDRSGICSSTCHVQAI
jgi:hypothetical protein